MEPESDVAVAVGEAVALGVPVEPGLLLGVALAVAVSSSPGVGLALGVSVGSLLGVLPVGLVEPVGIGLEEGVAGGVVSGDVGSGVYSSSGVGALRVGCGGSGSGGGMITSARHSPCRPVTLIAETWIRTLPAWLGQFSVVCNPWVRSAGCPIISTW